MRLLPKFTVKNRSGVTMVELLVASLLIMVIAVLAYAPMSLGFEKRTLESESTKLMSALQLSQNRSMTSSGGLRYGMKVDVDRYITITENPQGDLTEGNIVFVPESLSLSTNGKIFIFEPVTGRLLSDDTTTEITIKSLNYYMLIRIQPSGLMELTNPELIKNMEENLDE